MLRKLSHHVVVLRLQVEVNQRVLHKQWQKAFARSVRRNQFDIQTFEQLVENFLRAYYVVRTQFAGCNIDHHQARRGNRVRQLLLH